MTNKTKLTRIAAAVALTLGMSSIAMAETSSSMRGQIVDQQGQVVADTRVLIVHLPSGTTTTAVTNNSGVFVASGLRVGGPYRVVLENASFEAKTIEDIFLQLGDAYRFNAELEPQRQDQYERIAVTGRAINTTSLQAGSSSTWGEQEINNMPTFDRDLKDIVRQNPLATDLGDSNRSLSVGGNNPRYNSITVDGITQNDDFGLNSSGYPTNRSPISIDAIEQVSIQSVPFNARYSGFAGARVNAVTRSGTNDLSGSVVYEYSSDSLAGNPDASKYRPDDRRPEFSYKEETLGFTLGGPILRDRLFFFTSYERFTQDEPVLQGPLDSPAVVSQQISESVVDRVQEIAQQRYNVDPGTWNLAPDADDEKLLIKLDWNINNDHRASFTYQYAEDNAINGVTSSNPSTLNLSSNWYRRNQEMNSFATQVYSNWTNDFSTEFKLSYKEVNTAQDPFMGRNFASTQVRIQGSENPGGGGATVNLGPDSSRHANELSTDTLELQLHGEYLYNDHQIQFGTEYTAIDVYNLFVQNSLGRYVFRSLADFENGAADTFEYENAATNNPRDGAAEFGFSTFAAYLQDTWDVTWDLSLSFGLRYERVMSSDSPDFNQNFFDRYGFENTYNLDGQDLWLPRVSFNYHLNDNITLRGGVGRFSGGRPNVWISNAFTNAGNLITAPTLRRLQDINSLTVIEDSREAVITNAGDGNTTPIDPNFKMPVDTRYTFAIDYEELNLGFLGEGWFASAEVIYTEKDREVAWTNLSKVALLDENNNQVTTLGGRPLYVNWDPLAGERPDVIGGYNTDRHDILLTNVSGGRSVVSTFSLGNSWENGLSFRASYTNQDVRDITSGGSSTAHSNYNFQTAIDKQHPTIGTASYEIEHRFMASVNYRTEIFSGYASNFSLFWDRTSGRPYSYNLDNYQERGFGDGSDKNLWSSTNYLPYIPSGPNDSAVVYGGGLTYDQFMEWVEFANLGHYAGGYAERNADNRGPWNTNLDFRFEQEIPGLRDGHRGSFYVDIRNVLAMFTDNQRHTISFADTGVALVDVEIDEEGRYVYSPYFRGFQTSPPVNYNARASTWSAKIGVRYRF